MYSLLIVLFVFFVVAGLYSLYTLLLSAKMILDILATVLNISPQANITTIINNLNKKQLRRLVFLIEYAPPFIFSNPFYFKKYIPDYDNLNAIQRYVVLVLQDLTIRGDIENYTNNDVDFWRPVVGKPGLLTKALLNARK